MNPETEAKPVLITGCSSGIGLCVADGLKKRGYRVIATARALDDVDTLIKQGHEALQLDLDDSESINKAVTEVLTRTHNQLYALFNNGAYGQPGAVEDLSRDTLRKQFETNVFGWQELTNLVLPVMRQQGFGRVIQNSSVLGFVALKYRGAYNASKFAIEGLTDTLRLEFRGTDIHFSLIDGNGNNVFNDGTEQGSDTLRHAIAGMISAMPETTLLFAPHLNSYRRIRPGTHAPASAAWGYENRTTAIRIPGGPPAARRIEISSIRRIPPRAW